MDLHASPSLPVDAKASPTAEGRATRPQPSGVGVPQRRDFALTHNPKPRNNEAEVARKFETLIAATLLRTARAANLGDDGLGSTAGPLRDMIDNAHAEAIARAAPLGVARLLEQHGPAR